MDLLAVEMKIVRAGDITSCYLDTAHLSLLVDHCFRIGLSIRVRGSVPLRWNLRVVCTCMGGVLRGITLVFFLREWLRKEGWKDGRMEDTLAFFFALHQ